MAFDRLGKALFVLDVLIVVYIFWATVQKLGERPPFHLPDVPDLPPIGPGRYCQTDGCKLSAKTFAKLTSPYDYTTEALNVTHARWPRLELEAIIEAMFRWKSPGSVFWNWMEHSSYFAKLEQIFIQDPDTVVEVMIVEYFLGRATKFGPSYQDFQGLGFDLERHCLETTIMTHPRWVDSFALDHVYDRENRQRIEELGEKVRKAFSEVVRESPWADQPTQDRVIEKYTPASKSTYFEYAEALYAFRYEHKYGNAFQFPQTIYNAHNAVDFITVYWGLVKEPYYYPDAALEVIYGGMGLTIGHELAHTFDNNILAYNRAVLVGPEDNQQYDAQVECIQHQYENATVPYEFSNGTFSQPGELTDGEAIADNMGLRTSFRAYRTERNRLYGNDPPALKGLEQYTPDQLFYVAAGLMHCAHEGDNQLRVLLADVHPPGKIRMNEMMRNSQQFSEVFKCPLNSPMNPPKKCRVWRYKKQKKH
ncbi:unnamed protein product, partial [Mesorhabditis spiculigera]